MLATRARVSRIRPVRPYPAQSLPDVAWKLTWPFLVSTILAGAMITCIIAIVALEIASLAKGTNTNLYGNTSSTGAGFWCGVFFTIAAVLILILNWMRRTYVWATIALIATIIAACFAIILLALDAAAVQYRSDIDIDIRTLVPDKSPILAAQLAFAIFEFLLCLGFIGIYIAVLILAPRRLRRPQQRAFIYQNSFSIT